jgi:hypothetical protein
VRSSGSARFSQQGAAVSGRVRSTDKEAEELSAIVVAVGRPGSRVKEPSAQLASFSLSKVSLMSKFTRMLSSREPGEVAQNFGLVPVEPGSTEGGETDPLPGVGVAGIGKTAGIVNMVFENKNLDLFIVAE